MRQIRENEEQRRANGTQIGESEGDREIDA